MDKIKSLDTSVITRTAAPKAQLPATQDPKKAAEGFESMLVQQLLQTMWSTVPKGEMLSGSNEETMYRDMLNQAVATSVSEGRGIGIKEVVLRDLNRLDKK